MKLSNSEHNYDPFLYPPNYDLARLHKSASMPGVAIHPPRYCPCCQKKQKKPFTSWINRSIDRDFKDYGGSVVTYFWLLKLYLFVITLILVVYSVYLTYCIHEYCSDQWPECKSLLGFKIISNESLYNILKIKLGEGNDVIVRLLTMRGFAFVILMFANAFSLVVIKKFKQIHPRKLGVSDFSLLFKNTNLSAQEFALEIKQKFPDVEIKEVLKINSLEPFYTLYLDKINTYYSLRIEQKPKIKQKLLHHLQEVEKLSNAAQQSFDQKGERILIIFNQISDKNQVMKMFESKPRQKIKNFLDLEGKQEQMYCQYAPQPSQIIWQNIGSGDQYKLKYKILSIVYFLLLLVGSYIVLYFCMEIVYKKWFEEPWNFIMINIILTFVVYVALTFRGLMNKLSQLSHPSTYTSRTMFIVVTTVSFHFIFYTIIPTIYFSWATQDRKSEVLKMISNQALNFILFQFIIVGIDLMHYCWNKNLKKVQDETKPFGCQKVLHANIQFPRFPIEFKIIIMYKLWTFTIFFAFQSPLVLFGLFVCLIFLLLKDKHSLYFHYRMEIIDNRVQFNFLRIYSTFFSVYMFTIFVLTQHLQVEFWTSFGFTVVMIAVQLGIFGRNFQEKSKDKQEVAGSVMLLQGTYDELQNKESYKELYLRFKQNIKDEALDIEIRNFLEETGLRSLKSEASNAVQIEQ